MGVAIASWRVTGLDCPDCARSVEKAAADVPGVVSLDLNFATGVLLLEYDKALDPRARVVARVRAAGHDTVPLEGVAEAGPDHRPSRRLPHEAFLIASGILVAVAEAAGRLVPGWPPNATAAMFALAIVVGGALTARRSWMSLRARVLDMNVLMALAIIGAAAIGEWEEAATVVFLFSLGQFLEARALERTRRSIRDLVDLAPRTARVRRDGAVVEVPVGQVRRGDVQIVRAGDRIALDGVVLTGQAAVDESPITGESVPTEKAPGSTVFAGSLDTSGLLEVEVTAEVADSTLTRIVHLVEEAQATRAPFQRLVDRFTRHYTPVVVALAAAVAVVPPAVAALLGTGWGGFGVWFYRALVLLVVACPCALVISTPVAVVSAITRATRDGILVKGGAFLEIASTIRVVALDKTGTLTIGRPEVVEVVATPGGDASRVMALAAALEAGSDHPLARAVLRAVDGDDAVEPPAATGHLGRAGIGVRARVGGVEHLIGSASAVASECGLDGWATSEVERLERDACTVLALARCGDSAQILGLIGVRDLVRPEAPAIVERLRRLGVGHVVMLTGDNEATAAGVAAHSGVSEYRARLLPADKLAAVRELRERYGPVLMAGDGVNDAPALAAADVGVAMAAAGSDTALETADVALMAPELGGLAEIIALGRRTVRTVRFNVWFSVITKAAVLVAAAAGYAGLWLAVFADTGVALLVTLNGLRLLRRVRLP